MINPNYLFDELAETATQGRSSPTMIQERGASAMTLGITTLIVLTLTLLAFGQVLFKMAAQNISLAQPQSFINLTLFAAVCIYGVATMLWVLVLGRTPLSKAYPFYGLTFLMVPLLARIFLGETVSPRVWLGSLLIICGILVSTSGSD